MKMNIFSRTVYCLSVIITYMIMLCSCNPDAELNANENTPKIAEELLGMTVSKAYKHLEKNGFKSHNRMDEDTEKVFSKDESLSEFSYEAAIMLAFGDYNDTVRKVVAIQRMQTEKAARDLYWKWSHFAATVIKPTFSLWSGNLYVKDLSISQQPDKCTYYIGGTQVEQRIKDLTDDYNNGKITKEKYDTDVEFYKTQNQLKFWADFKREADNVDSAIEYYRNYPSSDRPKAIQLHVDMNNGGEIQLKYDTQH